jgi:hypothetical protein
MSVEVIRRSEYLRRIGVCVKGSYTGYSDDSGVWIDGDMME